MKRSDRYPSSNEHIEQKNHEPHYNTYYQPVGKPPKKKKSKRILLKILLIIIIIIALFIGIMYFLSTRDNVDDLRKIENKSSFVSADDMPDYVKGAFISMEDERFYKHHGFDLKGTTRALFSTISDRDVQGGSTITQQVVKNYFYDNDRSFTRKVKELFVAHRVEKQYDKNEILSFYLNNIYFGDNQYTIEGAANHYFGTTVNKNSTSMSHITVLQSAILASKVNAPSVYNINNMSENFTQRVSTNLEKMKQQNYITETQYQQAMSQLNH
ncbi:monofunctional peptidoglycan glycosyltransferase SgtB [Staphylococcus argenteus]|uniref:monofunctional peptidoglycan glycosyltransferase SgtB n=1 Tax=Staphylococcus argenteus TaxID=985002 RepID=UPI0005064370|nr:monofunctional peptidoglycan glycosyltransferase SgtB [Staphylococcus argenteus]MBE2133487.1 monofunctional peptidoglycan glycosyltransferase SgtB [Staphylococcus argenteus]MBE2146240.1 monofunctional peptidoglycan glycosyltransferase SgtB [Staphylococcus argenteus]MBE2161550.1 monofunctional peptidoglycan glycosyltransferase SgtB [Staphylococcus argenteus]MCG9797958.1 monofunctional peptidoglycan glycosyltransferase SgtB [Staphylococcus argenteus]MCG9800235.1 monofunctional peptidoglycan g